MPERAVFLDRDGVLNRALLREGVPYPPQTIEELEILPGVREACEQLVEAGFELIVVTNQPDISRNTQSWSRVMELNRKLEESLPIRNWEICPHDDKDGCNCRKPKPGLLTRAAERLQLNLADSVMVGDRWRDVEAGLSAGCRTVFLDYGYSERRPVNQHHTAASLLEAARWILQSTTQGCRS